MEEKQQQMRNREKKKRIKTRKIIDKDVVTKYEIKGMENKPFHRLHHKPFTLTLCIIIFAFQVSLGFSQTNSSANSVL